METPRSDQISTVIGIYWCGLSLIRTKTFWWLLFAILVIASLITTTTVLVVKKRIKTNIDINQTTVIENDSCDNISIVKERKWKQNGTTVAGGNGAGSELNQLSYPASFYMDNQRTFYIVDTRNDRIVKWPVNANIGEVVAGGNGRGNQFKQLNLPTAAVVDKESNSLIICDSSNRRIMQWSLENSTYQYVIISDILCSDLAIDLEGYLYISIRRIGEVQKWRIGDTAGIIVAGGNGLGIHLNQLSVLCYIFVDQDYSVYISDWNNDRVMKWVKGAKQGVVVAGGLNHGHKLQHLSRPTRIFVDESGSVFVIDSGANRIVRWLKDANLGNIIIAGSTFREETSAFDDPSALTFDEENNLYVIDAFRHRIQKFEIILD